MPVAKRPLAAILVTLGLCLCLVACGGSDDDASAPTTTVAAATTLPGQGAPSTTLKGSDPDSPFCVTVKRLNDDGSLDPANRGQDSAAERMQQAFVELEAAAPDHLKASIRTVARAIAVIDETQPSTQDELDALNSEIAQDDVSTASLELEAYVRDTCGVNLGG